MDGDTMDKNYKPVRKHIIKEDSMTRQILDRIREEKNKEARSLLKENMNGTQNAMAITNDPQFGQEVLKNQIDEFRATVDGGAQFSEVSPNDPTSCPLVYYPDNNNLTFSGCIPSLNNLKWQFSLKDTDGTGLFIWPAQRNDDSNSDNQGKGNDYKGFRLNKENLSTLNKLLGHYLNWKAQWEQSGGMLANLGKKEN